MSLVVIFAVIAVVFLAVSRWIAAGGKNRHWPDLKGKVAVVTGANTGIGKETAYGLAKQGATVIVCAREKERGEAAVKEIISRTGNQNVKWLPLDLADLSSVRSFASTFLKTYDRLDILINNAGVMMCPYLKTKDGLEMQIGVNHFGHFLLTNLLLDAIKANKGRIVNLSSYGHALFAQKGINFEDINSEQSYDPYFAYGQSKLANILFTAELQRRVEGSGVIVSAVHPGGVNTELGRHFNAILRVIVIPIMSWFIKSAWEGAQTSLYCALAPTLAPGKYYQDCHEEATSEIAKSVEQQKKLWEVSEKIVGL